LVGEEAADFARGGLIEDGTQPGGAGQDAGGLQRCGEKTPSRNRTASSEDVVFHVDRCPFDLMVDLSFHHGNGLRN
jgi:hypothetical protein